MSLKLQGSVLVVLAVRDQRTDGDLPHVTVALSLDQPGVDAGLQRLRADLEELSGDHQGDGAPRMRPRVHDAWLWPAAARAHQSHPFGCQYAMATRSTMRMRTTTSFTREGSMVRFHPRPPLQLSVHQHVAVRP